MVLEYLPDKIILASIAYALIDMFFLELLITMIFRTNQNGLHVNLGINNTRNTKSYALAFVILGMMFFAISNALQNPITNLLLFLGWKLYPVTIGLFGLVTFWVAKIILQKSWKNSMVIGSLIVFSASLITIIVSYLV